MAVGLVFAGVARLFATDPSPVPTEKPSAFPEWWFQRNVIVQTGAPIANPVWPTNYSASDDYAALVQGQLKNFATAAFDELEEKLPGGAGPDATTLVKSWFQTYAEAGAGHAAGDFILDSTGRRIPATTESTDDFTVLNLGQLKAIAKPFYDQLIQVGYVTVYPWTNSAAPADDFVIANLGQAKNLFSFDVSQFAAVTPVAEWKFEDGSGNTATDSSGHGNNGSLTFASTDSVWSTDAFEGHGALHFHGGAGAESMSANNSSGQLFAQTSGAPFSITLWFKAPAVPSGAAYSLLSTADAANPNTSGFRCALDNGVLPGASGPRIRFWSSDDGGTVDISSTSPISADQWHHLAITYNGGAATLYLDGNPVDPVSGSITPNALPFILGSQIVTAGPCDFLGNIDDVQIYSTALNASAITAQYNIDHDHNGLADRWELLYFGAIGQDADRDPDGDGLTNRDEFLGGTNPQRYFDATTVTLTIVGGNNQTGVAGHTLPQPLKVEVFKDSDTAPLPNAPVVFTIAQGGGGFLSDLSGGSQLPNPVTILGGADGVAQAFYQTGDGSVQPQIQAAVGGVTVTFVENIFRRNLLAAGDRSSAVTSLVGHTYVWGANKHGEQGDRSEPRRLAPAQITALDGTAFLTAGNGAFVAGASGGNLFVAGDNYFGQLGSGTRIDPTGFDTVVPSTSIQAAALGSGHAIFLTGAGAILSAGGNWANQLGMAGSSQSTPQLLSTSAVFSAVAAGPDYSLAIDASGYLWGWGSNENGQLAHTTPAVVPHQLEPAVASVAAVAAGGAHVVALLVDHTIMSWGANWSGQVGTGDTVAVSMPAAVAGLSDIVAVAAGREHSVALTSAGDIYVWGGNSRGQLGDGTFVDRSTPVKLTGLSQVVEIAAGAYHTLAITSDGQVWSWGANENGELGDGSQVTRAIPVAIADFSVLQN